MSVTDPLIKSLKYLIEEFYSVGEVITDESPYLASFCQTIEHSFTQGIKLGTWDFLRSDGQSMRRKQFWNVLEHFQTNGPTPLNISSAITSAQQNVRLKHADGRVRHLIRHCLVRKTLHVVVEFLITRKHDLESQWYFSNDDQNKPQGLGLTIITNEALCEQFRSLLLTVSTSLTFELDQKNSYFLDHTWNIPDMRTVEFVPTQELGLGIIYIDGYGIITKTKEGSVAADAPDIGVGDILIAMNGIQLFPAMTNGENEIMDIWKKCRRKEKPCRLTVIKPRCPATRGVFNPIRRILSEYQDVMEAYYDKRQKKIEEKLKEAEEKKAMSLSPLSNDKGNTPVADKSGCGTYSVKYVGEVHVGEHGGMGQIEGVIKTAVRKRSPLTIISVILDITEIGVITKSANGQCKRNSGNAAELSHNGYKDEEAFHDLQSMTGTNRPRQKSIPLSKIPLEEDDIPNDIQLSILADEIGEDFLFSHKFADISSCGKIVTDEKHFCYIAGDTFCTLSKQFCGYVFEARSVSQARLILNNIYQGFKRTTFFM
ncbi:uncharacterized protein LOC144421079 [Styela clava]